MLKQGSKAPAFALKDAEGRLHKLSDFLGRKVVLYFYPKDNTPGCTKEACDFRDAHRKLSSVNAVVIGISADSSESHAKFAGKFGLPFILLSDPDKSVIRKYGALREKSMFGSSFLGIVRSTFIIDEKGVIRKLFPDVSVNDHVEEVLKELKK